MSAFPKPLPNPLDPEEKTNPHLSIPRSPPSPMPSLGLLEPLFQDPLVTEIMVNDLRTILVEKEGKLFLTPLRFKTKEELQTVLQGILEITGQVLTPEYPYLDTLLPDGSRVHLITYPLAIYGPCLTLRKFPKQARSLNQLVQEEMLTPPQAHFLKACLLARLNMLLCGGTGSGKTTLLNALCGLIPPSERLIVIEDVPELSLSHPNVVRLQTKPKTPTGQAVPAQDLVVNALRMRPDRILVGECRKAEAWDMLQAMNTGHSGSMTTLHANSPRDGLARLETLCLLSERPLPLLAVRKQIASALQIVMQVKRFRDGRRRLVQISEITGMEKEVFTLQDLFTFSQGKSQATGLIPQCLSSIEQEGFSLPRTLFTNGSSDS